ncbi:MAG: 3-dehydroquinate synthase [Clostridia bacterium]|nr:3-dehydroquinate synthase [Clostridia bacterium]
MTTLHLNLQSNGYDIFIGKNLLKDADKFLNLDRKVLILTDDGVPQEYANAILSKVKSGKIVTVPTGEGSKSFDTMQLVLKEMCDLNMSRRDCIVGVGGGVIGDLAGFCASTYMRGIDFYNVPTTVLSQVDSSIGGKTAINFNGVKNIIGAFHQPKAVLIDVDTLKTLPVRQISNGLAESVKMALTSNEKLFEIYENSSLNEILENIENIIVESLKIKKDVVEKDEKESSLRKILNFGHTFGHGVEAQEEMHGFYHGECVAIGMLPMCAPAVTERLIPVLKKLNLPTDYNGDIDGALSFVSHDKKCAGDKVSTVMVEKIGDFIMKDIALEEFSNIVKKRFNQQ